MKVLHNCYLLMIFVLVTTVCPYDGDIKCSDTGRCLRSDAACNGYFSCNNGDDEANCGNEYNCDCT